MIEKNSRVVVSFKIKGTLLKRGKYHNHNGRTLERPIYSDCKRRTTLTERFVQHSISRESRPSRYQSFDAYISWYRMTEEQRLVWHIGNYVRATSGLQFEYELI